MDKLQPVLKHKYWIVFALAMILPTVGWWLDTSTVNAEIEAATAKAEAAFGSVPPANSPNATYAEHVKGINAKLAVNNGQYNRYLWDTQRLVMKWPARIDRALQGVEYRGKIDDAVRRMYRNDYFIQLEKLPEYANALTVENPDGNVSFNIQAFEPQVDRQTWGVNPPESDEMWEVQEDLWLAQSLLTAIARTNQGYANILQAPIKEISGLILCGGDPKAPKGGAGMTGPEGAAVPGGPAGAEAARPGMMGGMGGSLNSGFDTAPQGVDFDPAEVFGPDTLQAAGMPGGPGGEGAAAAPGGPAAVPGGPGAFAVDGRGMQDAKRKRYVDEEEGAPFKTRGFYLHLVMDHTKLPDLMVQLAALDWPVEIVRVQQQITNPDQLAYGSGGRGNMGQPGGAMAAGPGGQFGGIRGGGQLPGGGRSFGGFRKSGSRGAAPGGLPERRGAARPPMGRGPMGAGGARGNERDDKQAELDYLAQAALQKKSLVDVAIAGKLTLFQPPAEVPPGAEPAAPANQTAPPAAGETPSSDSPATTAPEAAAPPAETTSPGTSPADPASSEPETPQPETPAAQPGESPPAAETPVAPANEAAGGESPKSATNVPAKPDQQP